MDKRDNIKMVLNELMDQLQDSIVEQLDAETDNREEWVEALQITQSVLASSCLRFMRKFDTFVYDETRGRRDPALPDPPDADSTHTVDGVLIEAGLRVMTNDLTFGTVLGPHPYSPGWFSVRIDLVDTSVPMDQWPVKMFDGARMSTFDYINQRPVPQDILYPLNSTPTTDSEN